MCLRVAGCGAGKIFKFRCIGCLSLSPSLPRPFNFEIMQRLAQLVKPFAETMDGRGEELPNCQTVIRRQSVTSSARMTDSAGRTERRLRLSDIASCNERGRRPSQRKAVKSIESACSTKRIRRSQRYSPLTAARRGGREQLAFCIARYDLFPHVCTRKHASAKNGLQERPLKKHLTSQGL